MVKGWTAQIAIVDERAVWRNVDGVLVHDGTYWYRPDERLRQQVRDEEYHRLTASVPQRNYVAEYRKRQSETFWEWDARRFDKALRESAQAINSILESERAESFIEALAVKLRDAA